MLEKKITCITCPMGCDMVVCGEGDNVSQVEGNRCKRGDDYARSEFAHPLRILTTTVKLEGSACPSLSVRSDKPVPKELLMPCMKEIRKVQVKAPLPRYHVVIGNILGTGANIVATGEAKRQE